MATRFDPFREVTELYFSMPSSGGICRFDVDSLLDTTITIVSPAFGTPWVVADLDLDGSLEMVIQSSSALRIYSAPDWALRATFPFPGMEVVMYATACQIDSDSHVEIFATPMALGGEARAIVVDFDSVGGNFYLAADVEAFERAGGVPAIADFDRDGRTEFITGSLGQGHFLYEWSNDTLQFVGPIGTIREGNTYDASAVRPFPGGDTLVLIGSSLDNFRYELYQATGDNQFQMVHVFTVTTGWTGVHPSIGADIDCDGLDELSMAFYPFIKTYEWDSALAVWSIVCAIDEQINGTFESFHTLDLDQDGRCELSGVNHNGNFRSFPGPLCVGCNPSGECPNKCNGCYCECHADPGGCDHQANVQDVIEIINVAFRGHDVTPDSSRWCPYETTDLDCTGVTNIGDVVKMIDIAFRGVSAATLLCAPCQVIP
jgi:hypothetical protein